jgi:hypothetical protein
MPVHYRNRRLCRLTEALDKALKTLDKGFTECRTRQRRLGIQCIGKAFFAEYFFSGTWQRGLPSVRDHSAKKKQSLRRWMTETASLPSVPGDTRQRSYLCRVSPATLGKEPARQSILCRVLRCTECTALGKQALYRAQDFAECPTKNTRQSLRQGPNSGSGGRNKKSI